MTSIPKFEALTLARTALQDVWEARRFHVILSLVAILPRAVMDAFGLLAPYYAGVLAPELPPGYWQAATLFLLWAALWNTPMVVLWLRRFLVGPRDILRIGLRDLAERSVRLLGYLLLLLIGIVTLLMMITVVLGGLLSVFSGGNPGSMLPLGFLFVMILGLYFFFGTRFMLTFCAIPLGRHITLRDSWKRTEGIAGAVIGALALSLMGSVIIAQLCYWLLTLPFIGPEGLSPGNPLPPALHVVEVVVAPLSYLATALTAAIAARVYHSLRDSEPQQTDLHI